MNIKARWVTIGIAILIAFCVWVLFIPESTQTSEAGLFALLGRFHPLIVHFPIVLVGLTLVFEALGRTHPLAFLKRSVPILILLALISTMLSLFAGVLLYQSGEYSGELVRQHLWSGALLGIGVSLTFAAYHIQPFRPYYLFSLIVSNALLVYVGHLGGSLTHGEDFLTDMMPVASVKAPIEHKEVEEYIVFQDLIMPSLKRKCQSCHNPNKIKGGLLLTSFEEMNKGGKSGKPLFVSGDPEKSEIFVRVSLPAEDDDHMPPAGKPSLSDSEMRLLSWWIEQGADKDQLLGEFAHQAPLSGWIEDIMPHIIQTHRKDWQNKQEVAAYLKKVQAFTDKHQLVLTVDEARDSTRLAISMRIPPPIVNDNFLAELPDYGNVFSKLSLPATEITDDGLFHLSGLTEIRELYLQRTCIEGEGLAYLKELPHLEILNLSHTQVSDVDALHLLDFPALKRIYLFQSEVGMNVVEALRAHMPEVEILMQEGPYF